MKLNGILYQRQKFEVILDIISAIFDTPGIYFSCIVIDKNNVNFEKEFDNNPYKAYQEFTEILLKQAIDVNEILTILADYVTTPKNIKFEVDVKHNINKSLDRLAIGGIHRVDSKGVNIIQIVDLFIGAVSYSYKINLKLVSGDKNKIKVLNSILRKLSIKSFDGGLNSKRFKVFEHNNGLKTENKKGPSS